MNPTDTESVLLSPGNGSGLYVATVPIDTRRHCVPNDEGVPPALRGRVFDRSDDADRDFGLAIFRPRSRQL